MTSFFMLPAHQLGGVVRPIDSYLPGLMLSTEKMLDLRGENLHAT